MSEINFEKMDKALDDCWRSVSLKVNELVDGKFIKEIRTELKYTTTFFAYVLRISEKRLIKLEKSKKYIKGPLAVLFCLIALNPHIIGSIEHFGYPSKSGVNYVGKMAMPKKEGI